MRRILVSGFLGLALALPIMAIAQEKSVVDTRLPINPVAKLSTGDWTAFTVKEIAENMSNKKKVAAFIVTEIDGDDVTATMVTGGMKHFSRHEMTAEELFEAPPGSVKSFEVSDDKWSVGNREFACKRVSCILDLGGSTARGKVWLCPDVNGAIVALSFVVHGHETKMEIAGFGTKEKTTWGKSLEEIKKEMAKDEKAPGDKGEK